jgi:D-amino-acid dehydrogenase
MKVTIIGAGIVGIACAHALADEGHEIVLIDHDGPAAGASKGNAGWLAHTEIDLIASPKMLRQVPRFLLDPLGPLTIRPSYLLPLVPWLARLVVAAWPTNFERSAAALLSLQRLALPAWELMAATLGVGDLIHQRGSLLLYDSETMLRHAMPHLERQRTWGIAWDLLERPQLRYIEPALTERIVGGAYFPDMAHVTDPYLMTNRLFEVAMARGIRYEQRRVVAIEPDERPVLRFADSSREISDRIVVAAGAWSKPLAAGLGDRIPLDTERGYNVSFPGVSSPLSRPVSFAGHGFVVTPLGTGLRIGGAVELGGLALQPNHERSRAMHTKAKRFIRDLPDYDTGSRWMGFRPSIPDSLPVIGHARAIRQVVYAFGHGHYGLTQAAATGRLVAALVAGRAPAIDLAPFSPQRF